MRLKRFFTFLLSLTIFSTSAFAEELPRFQFVVPTNSPHFNPERKGVFPLEFRNQGYENFQGILNRCKEEKILPQFESKAPILYIYLPSMGSYLKNRRFLAEEAHRQFNEIYPGVNLKVIFRVARTNMSVTYVYGKFKSLVKNLKNEVGMDPEAKEYLKAMEKANEEAFQETMEKLEFTAPTARKIKYSIGTIRLLTVASARTMQTLPALASGGAPMITAMSLIVSDAAIEFFNVLYGQKIQRFFSKGPAKFKGSPWAVDMSKMGNIALWNFASFSLGRPLLMQTMAHAATPDRVPAVSMSSFNNLFTMNMIGLAFYTGYVNGKLTLRDKGWVSSSQIDMADQAMGIVDVFTGIMSSNPNWYVYRDIAWAIQWSLFAGVAALGKLAPNRTNRILAVDASITDWQDIHEEQVADASWHVDTEKDLQQALEIIKQIKAGKQPCVQRLENLDHDYLHRRQ